MKNNDNVTFLIVIPSYNQGVFLDETLSSIFNQNWSNLFVRVMDGGSTDNSLEIIKKYKKEYPNTFSYVSAADKGQTDAINKGILYFKKQKLNGENILFAYLNSDDTYVTDTFETVAHLVKEHPRSKWFTGGCRIISDNQRLIHQYIHDIWKGMWLFFLSRSLLTVLNPIQQPATFIRWDTVKKIGLFNTDLRYTLDYEYWLRLFSQVGRPTVTKEKLAQFRIHEASKGGSQFRDQFIEQYMVASTYTQSKLLLGLHQVHNKITVFLYSKLK